MKNVTKEEALVAHVRNISARYLPPTNTKGARVVIYDQRNEKRVIEPYCYRNGDILPQLIEFLRARGIEPQTFYYEASKGMAHVQTLNFETPIKQAK